MTGLGDLVAISLAFSNFAILASKHDVRVHVGSGRCTVDNCGAPAAELTIVDLCLAFGPFSVLMTTPVHAHIHMVVDGDFWQRFSDSVFCVSRSCACSPKKGLISFYHFRVEN